MISNDRILELDLSGFNEFQDLCKKRLICEIMGRYSNIILCNDDYTIIEALKHDASLDSTRIILPNAKYSFPLQNKINPYLLSYDEIYNKFKKT
ncbi:MAG: NFACT family protein [Clostridium sp.]|nr:MAG: NFACT family protein [Clostridium sp.]